MLLAQENPAIYNIPLPQEMVSEIYGFKEQKEVEEAYKSFAPYQISQSIFLNEWYQSRTYLFTIAQSKREGSSADIDTPLNFN